MNPVYAGLVLALTFAALIWFILSGQPTHLTVTFVIVTLGLGLGAAYIMSREQAREGAYAEGEDPAEDTPATNEAMNFDQVPDQEEPTED
ncbi:MAG TPA: hypothetical protein VMR52_07260 [Dehalococcoidia bacterium]|nr:hypothetical protein [Dehalococcoidia bacterium]